MRETRNRESWNWRVGVWGGSGYEVIPTTVVCPQKRGNGLIAWYTDYTVDCTAHLVFYFRSLTFVT